MVFQPKVNVAKEIVGLETLIRWEHPDEGHISPTEFIALAEESQLIIQIGVFSIKQVCQQLAQWRQEGRALVPTSINISGKHLVGG